MLSDDNDRDAKAERIVKELGDRALTKSHARHLSPNRCSDMGLKMQMLEDNQSLQDAVLSVHHACILTLAGTGAFKVIENHDGVASLSVAQHVLVQGPSQIPLE